MVAPLIFKCSISFFYQKAWFVIIVHLGLNSKEGARCLAATVAAPRSQNFFFVRNSAEHEICPEICLKLLTVAFFFSC